MALFSRLDPRAWEACERNPVRLLATLPEDALAAAAQDEAYRHRLGEVAERLHADRRAPGWFGSQPDAPENLLVAYFSLEFAVDAALPLYSGGLGVLAGDHLKAASDLGLPLVGVGLLYGQGYFRQRLGPDGTQEELYPPTAWNLAPVRLERDEAGRERRIVVDLAGEAVVARLWRADIGRVPLYLIDSDVPENSAEGRAITSMLYGGDRELRIRQELLLGIGGVRALAELGRRPTVVHMNEGHSAFLALERICGLMADEGLAFADARERVTASTLFTTHTPVPAGNEVFDSELVRRYLAPVARELDLEWEEFLSLGSLPDGPRSEFGMTVLALGTSAFANGVSRLHGETSRAMWRSLWPEVPVDEVPIGSVTNGIHTRTWLSPEMTTLLERHLGPKLDWGRAAEIPAGELWEVHERRRAKLVRRARAGLHPNALTIGFARRFAAYKRADLLLRQPERLVALLTDAERPVQMIVAGKAHPRDLEGKAIVRSVAQFASDPRLRGRLVVVEDYDMDLARYLVQGADVWLNMPRRPLEASGTSGMKAAVNGVLNLSVLDGWWVEGYAPDVGWAVGDDPEGADAEERDERECDALFALLEQQVVPLFYQRGQDGLPARWVEMMRASIGRLGPAFSTDRMVREYAERYYLPAHALAEGAKAAR